MGILAISEYIRHGKRNCVHRVSNGSTFVCTVCVCVNTFGGIPPVSTICAIESQGGA